MKSDDSGLVRYPNSSIFLPDHKKAEHFHSSLLLEHRLLSAKMIQMQARVSSPRSRYVHS
jgi:hypothetical protein